jgi:hypothetical protein
LVVLQSVDDRLTAKKLSIVTSAHVVAMSELIAQLATRTSEEDRTEQAKYEALNEKILNFLDSVDEFVKQPRAEPEVGAESETDPPKVPTESTQDAPSDASSLLDLDEAEEKPLDDNSSKK